jgi:hypothetical protein
LTGPKNRQALQVIDYLNFALCWFRRKREHRQGEREREARHCLAFGHPHFAE